MEPKQQTPEAAQKPNPNNTQNPPVVNDVSTPPAQTPASQPDRQEVVTEPSPDQPPVPSNPAIKSPPAQQPDVPMQANQSSVPGAQTNDSASTNQPKPAPTLGGASSTEDTPKKIDESEDLADKTNKNQDKKAHTPPKKPKSNKPLAFIAFAVVLALTLMGLIVMSYMQQAEGDSSAVDTTQDNQTVSPTDSAEITETAEQVNQLQREIDDINQQLEESERDLGTFDDEVDSITDQETEPESPTTTE